MTKNLQNIAIIASALLASIASQAQTLASVENLTLAPNSYWNGATSNPTVSTIGSFTSGNIIFPNSYNGNYGGYWEDGWAYSNMKDSTTSGSGNQYSARTASGYSMSANYLVAQPGSTGSILRLNAPALGKQLDGFYVTNSTFATLSMRDGDMFAKKFGGATGDDPDWFKLKITKYLGGTLQVNDTVVFYLADFRFTNNAQDYVVKNWQFVDLKPLGNIDSVLFTLSSSDNSGGYMNTPSYFCADNFRTLDVLATSIDEETQLTNLNIYPNPTTDFININSEKKITSVAITNLLGEVVIQSTENKLDVSFLQNGVYNIQVFNNKQLISTQKMIKQ